MLSRFILSHLLWRPEPLTPLSEYTSKPSMPWTGLPLQQCGASWGEEHGLVGP